MLSTKRTNSGRGSCLSLISCSFGKNLLNLKIKLWWPLSNSFILAATTAGVILKEAREINIREDFTFQNHHIQRENLPFFLVIFQDPNQHVILLLFVPKHFFDSIQKIQGIIHGRSLRSALVLSVVSCTKHKHIHS